MEKSLRIGFFISFILSGIISVLSGVLSVNDDSINIGMGLLVLALIWGILFIFPKSPIRRRCWSVRDKLRVIVRQGKGNKQYLTVDQMMSAIWPIKVDKIILSIGKTKIIPKDWKSHEMLGDEPRYINFDRPEWLGSGNYSARLIAYSNTGYSRSEMFTLEVRD